MIEPFEFEAHTPKHRKGMSWPVCSRCGLVYFRNTFTAWAIKHGCNNTDHPNYQKERAKAGSVL